MKLNQQVAPTAPLLRTTLDGLMECIERNTGLVHQEVQLARLYATDSDYADRFNAALSKRILKHTSPNVDMLWPLGFERSPLVTGKAMETMDKLRTDFATTKAAFGSPTTAFAIDQALAEYGYQLEVIRSINSITLRVWLKDNWINPDVLPVEVPLTGLLKPMHEALPESEMRPELFSRRSWSDEELRKMSCEYSSAASQISDHISFALGEMREWELPLIDEEAFSVHFRGRHVELGNTVEFKMFKHLYMRREEYHQLPDLAEALTGASGVNIRSAKNRLRKALLQAGMNDLAQCLVTRRCSGYGLFLSRLIGT